MGQRVKLKKDRNSVKGYAIKVSNNYSNSNNNSTNKKSNKKRK